MDRVYATEEDVTDGVRQHLKGAKEKEGTQDCESDNVSV